MARSDRRLLIVGKATYKSRMNYRAFFHRLSSLSFQKDENPATLFGQLRYFYQPNKESFSLTQIYVNDV